VIFVTVGTQLAFDRLIGAVDVWAARNPSVRVFAQVGPAATAPRHVESAAFLPPSRVQALMEEAELIVSHAGMGSVLGALALRKPIVIVPRRAALGEHRNDHQLATAHWLEGRVGVHVAWDEDAVPAMLDVRDRLPGGDPIAPHACGPLVDRLRECIDDAMKARR
jgi:UDP-N-acetylglucosamine transferase subunit ALG13